MWKSRIITFEITPLQLDLVSGTVILVHVTVNSCSLLQIADKSGDFRARVSISRYPQAAT